MGVVSERIDDQRVGRGGGGYFSGWFAVVLKLLSKLMIYYTYACFTQCFVNFLGNLLSLVLLVANNLMNGGGNEQSVAIWRIFQRSR